MVPSCFLPASSPAQCFSSGRSILRLSGSKLNVTKHPKSNPQVPSGRTVSSASRDARYVHVCARDRQRGHELQLVSTELMSVVCARDVEGKNKASKYEAVRMTVVFLLCLVAPCVGSPLTSYSNIPTPICTPEHARTGSRLPCGERHAHILSTHPPGE